MPTRAAHALLRRFGVDLVRYPGDARRFPEADRQRLLAAHSVALILDVGASVGQFAETVRQNGYSGRIMSFEPLEEPFAELARRTARDPLWDAQRLAIGARSGNAVMHTTADSLEQLDSSAARNARPRRGHRRHRPDDRARHDPGRARRPGGFARSGRIPQG
jgi:hypothetical protein